MLNEIGMFDYTSVIELLMAIEKELLLIVNLSSHVALPT